MKASNIEDDHHFVKHCKNKFVIRENGIVIGIHPFAFELRRATDQFPQEKTISGVYYEFFDGNALERMCACYHFIEMEIKKKDAIVRMKAGTIKEQGKKRSRSLRVKHDPYESCLAYAAIHGLPVQTDDELCALLAADPVVEIAEATSIL